MPLVKHYTDLKSVEQHPCLNSTGSSIDQSLFIDTQLGSCEFNLLPWFGLKHTSHQYPPCAPLLEVIWRVCSESDTNVSPFDCPHVLFVRQPLCGDHVSSFRVHIDTYRHIEIIIDIFKILHSGPLSSCFFRRVGLIIEKMSLHYIFIWFHHALVYVNKSTTKERIWKLKGWCMSR